MHAQPLRNFNPRTRKGCDIDAYKKVKDKYDFNPRTRKGCDGDEPIEDKDDGTFQSTHPQGVRRIALWLMSRTGGISIHAPARGATPATYGGGRARLIYFNPRTRKGCDGIPTIDSNDLSISIHAPARGATTGAYKGMGELRISIHAPARGATSLYWHEV